LIDRFLGREPWRDFNITNGVTVMFR